MPIDFDDNSITVYRGQTRKKTVYLDEESKVRLSAFFDKLLATGETITSTWSLDPDTSLITVASATSSGQATECYATAADGSRGTTAHVKNKIVASGGETHHVTFKLIVCET